MGAEVVADRVKRQAVLHEPSYFRHFLGATMTSDKINHRARQQEHLGHVLLFVKLDNFLEPFVSRLADDRGRNRDGRHGIDDFVDSIRQFLEGVKRILVVSLLRLQRSVEYAVVASSEPS